MGSDMQIAVSQRQGRVPVTVFQVKGEIDAHNYEQLQTQANESFEGGMRNLLLDLTEVTYMSSAGLRAIHAIYLKLGGDAANEGNEAKRKRLEDDTFKSPHLKLLNPPPHVLKVIKTLGFDLFLEIYNDPEEAVASF